MTPNLHDLIINYNSMLLENNTNITILDYVNAINDQFYKIDISFINELLDYVIKDDFCIPHTLLVKYGILSEKNLSTHVKDMLDQYGMIKDEDFKLSNVRESVFGGCTHKINYLLHPDTFKLCLMRSKNERKYAKYYILLERCIKYYNDYQIDMLKQAVISLTEKIEDKTIELNEVKEVVVEKDG